MKMTLKIVGGVLILLGGLWVLQGLDLLVGSAMSGQAIYAVLGALLIVGGIVVEAMGFQRKSTAPEKN